jgi:hypothetical protein
MQNGKLSDGSKYGELLEYRHLIANQTTIAAWKHPYGNKIRCLAQGMMGMDYIPGWSYLPIKNLGSKKKIARHST